MDRCLLPHGRERDTVCHVKTTLNIDDSVMQRLREEAARRRTTMSALVEAGLRLVLGPEDANGTSSSEVKLPAGWHGGEYLVDITNREELDRVLAKR